MDAISSALNTWLNIGQINGDPEREREREREREMDDVLRALDQVLKYKEIVKS